jgi:hypothetical protein
MWYLDGGMVFAQSFTALNEALVTICKAAEQIGLEVNLSKCALVVPAAVDSIFAGQPPAPLSEIPRSATSVVLGAPIGTDSFEATHFLHILVKVERLCMKLPSLCDPHCALHIL